jgi:protein SCO1/2
MSKKLFTLAFAGGIVIAAGAWTFFSDEPEQRSAAALMDAVMWNKEPVGGPFALVDHNGNRRTDKDFRGKVLLVYFGFSYCTDVCPTDLQSVAAAIDKLGPEGEKVQPLFISVDPEKDTPAQLQGYVALFHPRLVGLTGTQREIRKVAHAYKVYVANNGAATGTTGAIDHSGFVYLVGANGDYLDFFPPGTAADRMVAALRPHLAALRGP